MASAVEDFLSTPARQSAVLRETGHRPWPLEERSWLMAQTWDVLLFAHWCVPVAAVRAAVPSSLPVDTFHGDAWIGVTPFVVRGLRLRGTPPLPAVSAFPELNVRTYVTLDGKPGIFFFSLDAASAFAVQAARRFYRLPYFRARMAARATPAGIEYRSVRVGGAAERSFRARYRPTAGSFEASAGSLEYFLTERYCLYTVDRGRVLRADIHHPPWPLQVAEAEIEQNTMTPPGVELAGEPLLHFAARQDVLIWAPVPLG